MTRIYQVIDDEGATVDSGWLAVVAYDQHGQRVGEPQMVREIPAGPQDVQVHVHISDDIGDLIDERIEAAAKHQRRLGRMA